MLRFLILLLLPTALPGLLSAQLSTQSTGHTEDTLRIWLLAPVLQADRNLGLALGEAPLAQATELPSALQGLRIGTKTYIRYEYIERSDGAGGLEEISRFNLKRGYIDIRKSVTDYLTFRVTPDVHQDDSGDWKVRIKYLHAKFQIDSIGFIGKPYAEVGIAHMPWLDFEEHINLFRMQGTMFTERNGLFNSADLGFQIGGNLGPELPQEYRDNVNKDYAGRWGSFSIGMFNGGGYHGVDRNNRMALEGRLTLRPLPSVVPGLQFSVFGITGKGNTADAPDWNVLNGMVSYESRVFNATAQYYDGAGNQKGTAVDAGGTSLEQRGLSAFAEVRVPQHEEFSFFGRFDHFDTDVNVGDTGADVRERIIVGAAWQFYKGHYWVVNYDRLNHSLAGLPSEYSIEVTLQIKY